MVEGLKPMTVIGLMSIESKEQLDDKQFNSYERFLFPKELQELIVNDAEIKRIIDEELAPASNKYYARIEEIRKENNLQYPQQVGPIWVKDSKFSTPYLKEDIETLAPADILKDQSLNTLNQPKIDAGI
jgi:hypothetical protein